MKYIQKGKEPVELTQWKAKANENWKPRYEYMYHDVKDLVKKALMAEQGYICCYCERRLDDDYSHIEHFRTQSGFEELAISYDNMICSCQKPKRKEEKIEPEHCGALRGKWFDEDLFISPFDPNCEERFAYSGDGHIRPRVQGDLAAETTIAKLGLNIKEVIAKRKGAMDAYETKPPTREELDGLIQRDTNGCFAEYCTAIRYIYRDLL